MGQDILTLAAEPGSSFSNGSIRLYAVPYGCIDLYDHDPAHHRCAVGIVVASAYRRQGYALAMLRQLRSTARDTFRLHTLYADIAASNTASLTLFAKAGFSQCGLFHDWLFVDGHYADAIRMQLTL